MAVASVVLVAAPPCAAQSTGASRAADLVRRAVAEYKGGHYLAAIPLFLEAHKLAPHPHNLFHVARCHQNLGELANALKYFQRAKATATAPDLRCRISDQIAAIRGRPIRVFVHSSPAGAVVTVDGAPKAEPKVTPMFVELLPGPHVLVVRLDGHRASVHGVSVNVGEQPVVRAKLDPDTRGRRLETSGWHTRLEVRSVVGWAKKWGLIAGPGAFGTVSYNRWYLGVAVTFFPLTPDSDRVRRRAAGSPSADANASLLLVGAEGGYVLPFNAFYLHGFVNASGTQDQLTITLTDGSEVSEKPGLGFSGALGGGVQAAVTRWLSVGLSARVGLFVNRADGDFPVQFPFVAFGGDLAFHL